MLTSVHPIGDTRIYHREALSLAQAGYKVTLIATGADSHTTPENIEIIGLPRPRNRLGRMFNWQPFLKAALQTRADIYHFHDPDLLLVGWWLQKQSGHLVIYDCHEPYELKILDRTWLPGPTRAAVSSFYKIVEQWIVRQLKATIVANDGQLARYPQATLVRNLPRRDLALLQPRPPFKGAQAVYVGLINPVRGMWNMLEAFSRISNPQAELALVGRIDTARLAAEIDAYLHAHHLGQRVKLLGRQPYQSLPQHLASATVGLVPFVDTPSLRIAIPTKLFEYMAFGLPTIASDLPPARRFIESARCGLLAPASDIERLASALEYLLANPAEAWQLGENGRQAVLNSYNWEIEEQKLLALYGELLN